MGAHRRDGLDGHDLHPSLDEERRELPRPRTYFYDFISVLDGKLRKQPVHRTRWKRWS